MRVIHRCPVNSPHKLPVTRKMLPFDDVIVFPAVYRGCSIGKKRPPWMLTAETTNYLTKKRFSVLLLLASTYIRLCESSNRLICELSVVLLDYFIKKSMCNFDLPYWVNQDRKCSEGRQLGNGCSMFLATRFLLSFVKEKNVFCIPVFVWILIRLVFEQLLTQCHFPESKKSLLPVKLC